MKRSLFLSLFVLINFIVGSTTSIADIEGFELSNWHYVQADSGNPASVTSNSIQITNGTSQRRSFWYGIKQNVDTFSVSFHYAVAGGGFSSNPGGTTFTIQNDIAEFDAVTDSNFEHGFGGIDNSVGVTLELNASIGAGFIGFYTNGNVGNGSVPLAPHSPGGNGFDVSIEYDGSLLHLMVDDGINTPFTQSLFVSPEIAETIGAGKGIVGFGSCSSSDLDQTISNFQFTCNSQSLPGDVNGDGCVDLLDVQPFVDALTNGKFVAAADINQDGVVDLLDVSPFVELLDP